MWTAGVIVFIASISATGNIAVSGGLALGYYVTVGALSFVLHKLHLPFLPRFVLQLVIATGIVIFGCREIVGGKVGGSDVSSADAPYLAEGKDDKLRDFAMKDAPAVWKAYQHLSTIIEEKDKKNAELRETLLMFGVNPDTDADFTRLLKVREELAASCDAIKAKLEEAYLQARKFAATPDRKEFDELRKRAVEDGVREAQTALRRYKAMKEQK